MTGNRNRISVAPLRSTLAGKLILMGNTPRLPPDFLAVGDLVGDRTGVIVQHGRTGLYALWTGSALQSLPQHKVAAAVSNLGRDA